MEPCRDDAGVVGYLRPNVGMRRWWHYLRSIEARYQLIVT